LLALSYAAITLPMTDTASAAATGCVLALIALDIVLSTRSTPRSGWSSGFGIPTHLAVFLLLGMLGGVQGLARTSYFAALAACWLLAWRLVTVLSGDGTRQSGRGWVGRIGVPALFGVWILIIWETTTRGLGIPFVLLPPPSAIGAKIVTSLTILAADFRQTVLKAVLFGFFVGSGAGFLVAVLADRYKFLTNGLLPIGNLVRL
jgi:NitT/TauT family transport system permease protein